MKKRISSHQQTKIIDGLCLLYENGRKTKENAEKIISDIYKIAHLNGSCENPHQTWHDYGFKLIDELNEIGMANIDREDWKWSKK